jgi:Carbohydrate-binding module family 5/12
MTLVPNYVPTDWVDTVTPVDESHMDKLDTAVDQHADAINGLDTRVTTVEGRPVVPAVVNGQWIKGVSGAMVWSAITQADVSGLSAALTAKQDASAKGQANGYASLDSGGKVPTTQLPVSIDLRWAGTYAGATAYKEGDVVIYNGVSYMALRPTTGETPVPWSTAAGSLQTFSAALSADVALTTVGQNYDGPSLSLTAGTYELFGAAFATRAGNGGFVTVRLWDGTTVIAPGEIHTSGLASGQGISIPLSGILTLAATTTIKISAQASAGGHIMRAATSSGGSPPGATYLNAVKVG